MMPGEPCPGQDSPHQTIAAIWIERGHNGAFKTGRVSRNIGQATESRSGSR